MRKKFNVSVEAVDHAGMPPLTFTVEDHDDLLATVERVRSMNIVPEQEVSAFAIGLKLLAGVVIQHRDEPLFAELSSALPTFIKRLKARSSAQSHNS